MTGLFFVFVGDRQIKMHKLIYTQTQLCNATSGNRNGFIID